MYHKINYHLGSPIDFERLKGELVTDYTNPASTVLKYWRIKDRDYLNSLLPERSLTSIPPSDIKVAEISGRGSILPHKDHDVLCCANYYLSTGNAKTHFYHLKQNGVGFAYKGKVSKNVFPFDQVQEVGAVEPQANQMYLLDVQCIHAVNGVSGVRQFITWQWNKHDYNTVKSSLL